MEAPKPRAFPPAEAGALLAVVTLLGLGLGTLVGWALGSASVGLIVGAVLGLPAGVAVVVRRYRGYFA
jgi:F0F1-type ATP synthase assembly protein I